jgi:hypothetical protein
MKIAESYRVRSNDYGVPETLWGSTPMARPGFLQLVTESELAGLQQALAHGGPPLDFTAKLDRIKGENLTCRFVEQQCRLFMLLLLAAQDGAFREPGAAERDRLLRVLAYVRKDDDYTPDYRPDGYADDQQEVRSAASDLAPLLHSFKSWRLRNQVPGLWLNGHHPSVTGRLTAT